MSTYRARCVILAMTGCILTSVACAQALLPGARVRVVYTTTSAPTVIGEVVRIAGDSVFISTAGNLAKRASNTVWLASGPGLLEVRTAVHTKAVAGMVIGALAGAAAGYAIGSTAPNDCGGSFGPCYPPAVLGAMGGSVVGMLVGGIIGHGIQSEDWQRVDHPPVRLGFAPVLRGMMFSASISF